MGCQVQLAFHSIAGKHEIVLSVQEKNIEIFLTHFGLDPERKTQSPRKMKGEYICCAFRQDVTRDWKMINPVMSKKTGVRLK